MINYDNCMVRRQDRLLDEARAVELLQSGEYGFLAMASADGGYGVPINYVVDDDVIYLHCATEGRKLRAIENDERVSFVVVGKTELQPAEFTTYYESVVVMGRAHVVDDIEKRKLALNLLVRKYAPQHISAAPKAIENSIHRTAVIAIKIERLTGKRKQAKL